MGGKKSWEFYSVQNLSVVFGIDYCEISGKLIQLAGSWGF